MSRADLLSTLWETQVWRYDLCIEQPLFVQRLGTCFKEHANPGRTIHFTHIVGWMGAARELSVGPVLDRVEHDFRSGQFGAVTASSEIHINGVASITDALELRTWYPKLSGPGNTTVHLRYELRRTLPGGTFERIAEGEQSTSWIAVSSGHARIAPYPDYLQEFFHARLPRGPIGYSPPAAPSALLPSFLGETLYQSDPGPTPRPLLMEQSYETGQVDSNLVGNIYFTNYYVWQARIRDRYLRDAAGLYRADDNGELLCSRTRVRHLREAFPFDTIRVRMYLKTLWQRGVTFYFEYFTQGDGSGRNKVAVGDQDAVWVERARPADVQPALLPATLRAALAQMIQRETGAIITR